MKRFLMLALTAVSGCTTATLDESRLPVAQNTFVADTEDCVAMFRARAFDSMTAFEGCNIAALKRFAAAISLREPELITSAERRLLALAADADATFPALMDEAAQKAAADAYGARQQQIAYDFMTAVYATHEYTKSRNAAIWQGYLDWRATLPNRTNVYIQEERTFVPPPTIAPQPVLRCGIGGNCRP